MGSWGGFLKKDSGNLCGIFRRPRLFSMTPDDTPERTKTHPSNPSFQALVVFASRGALMRWLFVVDNLPG